MCLLFVRPMPIARIDEHPPIFDLLLVEREQRRPVINASVSDSLDGHGPQIHPWILRGGEVVALGVRHDADQLGRLGVDVEAAVAPQVDADHSVEVRVVDGVVHVAVAIIVLNNIVINGHM